MNAVPGLAGSKPLSLQMRLPGFDEPPRPFHPGGRSKDDRKPDWYNLILAIQADATHAQCVNAVAPKLCVRSGMNPRRLMDPDRLHITLHGLGAFGHGIPFLTLDAAMVAAARVQCPELHITFDHVVSFPESDAFVLGCDRASHVAVARLRRPLQAALKRVGLKGIESTAPHMTLLYDRERTARRQPIDPIAWTVRRFALVISHVGIGYHEQVAEWKLDQ